jgi:hypothetical protein
MTLPAVLALKYHDVLIFLRGVIYRAGKSCGTIDL